MTCKIKSVRITRAHKPYVTIGGKRYTAKGLQNWSTVRVCGRTAHAEGRTYRLRVLRGRG